MKKRPNILLITSDQQHWHTLGFVNPEISTPNLDRLTEQGTYFSRAYCPNPTCTPTRSSIITGKYPSQHGAWSLGTKLSENEHTVGEDFLAAGYRTALIGKAHFQPLKSTETYPSLEANPLMQDLAYWKAFKERFYGFEHVELMRNHTHEAWAGQHYALWLEENGLDNWRDYFVAPTGRKDPAQQHTWEIPEAYHYNNWIAQRSCAKLDEYQRDEDSFFLWASFPDPHPPYLVSRPWDEMYDPDDLTLPAATAGEHVFNPPHFAATQQKSPDFSAYRESGYGVHGLHSHVRDRQIMKKDMAVYYGMISMMDKYIGQILDKLDHLGLAEDTIVVFTTDHGHFFGQHGLIAKGPFHYEDMIRVPFIVRWPGRIQAGRTTSAMTSLVDLAPTFLRLAGLQVPQEMTGVDQSPVWLGSQDKARDHILCENHHEPTTVHLKTYVNERYKITVYYNKEYGELYDLREDPQEVHNHGHDPAYREIKTGLLLRFLLAEMDKEPMPMPRIANA